MVKKYAEEFLKRFFFTTLAILIFLAIAGASAELMIIVGVVIFIITSYTTHTAIAKEINNKLTNEFNNLNAEYKEQTKLLEQTLKDESLWKQILLERTSGFPSLITRIQEYEEAKDEYLSDFLDAKSHPAHKAADVIRAETKRRREAEFIRKRTEAIIEYYEYLAPFLLDVKDDVGIDLDQGEIFGDYTEEELEDPVIKYISKEEYRKLPSFERNQLALDRFWKRPKSNWLLGKLYERYIGFLYEKDGYEVEYHGIQKKLQDLGIDLICRKGGETILVQCKNWAKFKTIYEKHIFQLFGTSFQFRDSHPHERVSTIFITTTVLSEIARKFANELKINLKENFRFDQSYPCIKCNVNITTNEKIYHLPFDQQYDKTKISRKGEIYCSTTKEAEDAGFRRAFRWHGGKEKNIA